MADAKSGVHQVKLKEIQIPPSLIKGDRFIKWDDVSTIIYIYLILSIYLIIYYNYNLPY